MKSIKEYGIKYYFKINIISTIVLFIITFTVPLGYYEIETTGDYNYNTGSWDKSYSYEPFYAYGYYPIAPTIVLWAILGYLLLSNWLRGAINLKPTYLYIANIISFIVVPLIFLHRILRYSPPYDRINFSIWLLIIPLVLIPILLSKQKIDSEKTNQKK